MACIGMADIVMAYIVMAYIVIAYIVLAYIVMAYVAMAHIAMAYIVMATCVASLTRHIRSTDTHARLHATCTRMPAHMFVDMTCLNTCMHTRV